MEIPSTGHPPVGIFVRGLNKPWSKKGAFFFKWWKKINDKLGLYFPVVVVFFLCGGGPIEVFGWCYDKLDVGGGF